MGPYALPVNQNIDPQQPKTWRNTDRLFTLGNGENESDRSNALIIYKSGLAEWFNATVFGKYKHENDGVPVLPKRMAPCNSHPKTILSIGKMGSGTLLKEIKATKEIQATPGHKVHKEKKAIQATQLPIPLLVLAIPRLRTRQP